MGSTPKYGIYYDDPALIALGRTQDELQAKSIEAALGAVQQTAAEELREGLADMHDEYLPRVLIPVDAHSPGFYQVGTNYKAFPLLLADQSSLGTALNQAGAILDDDPRILTLVDAHSPGFYQVGTNYKSLPVSADTTQAEPVGMAVASGAGLKSIRVPVTAGWNSNSGVSPTSGTVRYLLRWNFPVARWRLILRNTSIRDGGIKSEPASFGAVYIGKHDGAGGFDGDPIEALDAFTLPAGGDEYIGPWTEAHLPTSAEGEVVVSTSYTTSQAPYSNLGYGYQLSGDTSKAASRTGEGFKASSHMPYAVTIQVQVPAFTPVVAVMGDSISVGVGASRPVLDSAISQWAQPRGAVAVMAGSSGDQAQNCVDFFAYKWVRFMRGAHAPDAFLYTLGTNDLGAGGRSAPQVQDDSANIIGQARALITSQIFAQHIIPRSDSAWSEGKETERLAYNRWLEEGGLGQVATWLPGSKLSADGRTLDAGLGSADKLHLTAEGYRVMQEAYGHMASPVPGLPW